MKTPNLQHVASHLPVHVVSGHYLLPFPVGITGASQCHPIMLLEGCRHHRCSRPDVLAVTVVG